MNGDPIISTETVGASLGHAGQMDTLHTVQPPPTPHFTAEKTELKT